MTADTEARRLFVQVAALRERAERAEVDRDRARAQRDEAVELLREWARWYAMVGARTVPP